jgi:hypothetical protein
MNASPISISTFDNSESLTYIIENKKDHPKYAPYFTAV